MAHLANRRLNVVWPVVTDVPVEPVNRVLVGYSNFSDEYELTLGRASLPLVTTTETESSEASELEADTVSVTVVGRFVLTRPVLRQLAGMVSSAIDIEHVEPEAE